MGGEYICRRVESYASIVGEYYDICLLNAWDLLEEKLKLHTRAFRCIAAPGLFRKGREEGRKGGVKLDCPYT